MITTEQAEIAQGAIARAAERVRDRIEAQLFGVTSDCQAEPFGAASIDDVLRIQAALLNRGPGPVAIWFVDSPREYRWFLEQMAELIPQKGAAVSLQESEMPVFGSSFYGIRVVEWYKRFFDPETEAIFLPWHNEKDMDRWVSLPWYDGDRLEIPLYQGKKRVWPWFCNVPGVWVEMSNGKHYQPKLN